MAIYSYWSRLSLRARLQLASVAILVLGAGAAALIYLFVPDTPDDVLGYDVAGGQIYAVEPGSSKAYIHDLKQYGGTGAVIADEFNRWFAGLWRGKALASTIALLSLACAASLWVIAKRLPRDS